MENEFVKKIVEKVSVGEFHHFDNVWFELSLEKWDEMDALVIKHGTRVNGFHWDETVITTPTKEGLLALSDGFKKLADVFDARNDEE